MAKLLLSAIISDTLNLKSPTTTDADRFAVSLLSQRAVSGGLVLYGNQDGKLVPVKVSENAKLVPAKLVPAKLVLVPENASGVSEATTGALVDSTAVDVVLPPTSAATATTAAADELLAIDTTAYASELFRAKTQWICSLGAKQMVSADVKEFTTEGGGAGAKENAKDNASPIAFGIGVLEIAGAPKPVLEKVEEIRAELALLKEKKQLRYLFLCVVDVVTQTSICILPNGETDGTDGGEQAIVLASFAGAKVHADFCEGGVVEVGNFASRKKQFLPLLQAGVDAA